MNTRPVSLAIETPLFFKTADPVWLAKKTHKRTIDNKNWPGTFCAPANNFAIPAPEQKPSRQYIRWRLRERAKMGLLEQYARVDGNQLYWQGFPRRIRRKVVRNIVNGHRRKLTRAERSDQENALAAVVKHGWYSQGRMQERAAGA